MPRDQTPRQPSDPLLPRGPTESARIAVLVISIRPFRQRQGPHQVVGRQRQDPVAGRVGLRRRPVDPTEVRLVQYQPYDLQRREVEIQRSQRRVVRYVRTGTAPHEEAGGEIGVVSQPGLGIIAAVGPIEGVIAGPQDGVDGIVVGGREAVLGGEAVVDGDDQGREEGGHAEARFVERPRGCAEEDESTAVEVDDERELGGGGGGRRERGRTENADGGGGGAVEAAVIEEGGGAGRDGGERGETSEGAIWVGNDM